MSGRTLAFFAALILGGVFFVAHPARVAHAADVSVTYTAQSGTHTRQASLTSNFCSSTSTLVNNSGTAGKRAYHAFTTAVPAGNTVTAATLKVWSQQTSATKIDAFVQSTWPNFPSGCSITWANQPVPGPLAGSSAGQVKNVYTSIPLNPALIPAAGTFGLMVNSQAAADLKFDNDCGGCHKPQLVISYAPAPAPTTTPAPPPTTTTAPPPPPGNCVGQVVNPGDDLQAAIDAAAAATTFCLQPGTHRIVPAGGLTPKAGDVFVGVDQSAVVSGSKQVTGWAVSGSDWVATGFLPTTNPAGGPCDTAHPLCNQAQDVFRDGTWLTPVASRAALVPGTAFLDLPNNKIYVRDDPTGHTVEQAWAKRLFTGPATGVQIKNLTLQHAASAANTGALDPVAGGTGWVLDHNEIRWNHGYGTGPGNVGFGQTLAMTITANNVHHNGQDGTGADGAGNVVRGNEVHDNSYAGYQVGWDAGNKFGHARNLVVDGNYYHDERGPGIWCDINCEDAVITNNYVARTQRGIMFEISCRASIHDNVVVDSADPPGESSWGGIGILIANSEGADVYSNQTFNGARGIWAIHQDRSEARDCTGGAEHVVKNLSVHGNSVDFNAADPPFAGKAGVWTDTGRADLYTSLGNSFAGNTYHDLTPSSEWNWGMPSPPYTPTIGFGAWQAAGQDTAGTVAADDPAPPAPPALVVGPQPAA